MIAKLKKLYSYPNVRKWLFYASLIVFAGVVFKIALSDLTSAVESIYSYISRNIAP